MKVMLHVRYAKDSFEDVGFIWLQFTFYNKIWHKATAAYYHFLVLASVHFIVILHEGGVNFD